MRRIVELGSEPVFSLALIVTAYVLTLDRARTAVTTPERRRVTSVEALVMAVITTYTATVWWENTTL